VAYTLMNTCIVWRGNLPLQPCLYMVARHIWLIVDLYKETYKRQKRPTKEMVSCMVARHIWLIATYDHNTCHIITHTSHTCHIITHTWLIATYDHNTCHIITHTSHTCHIITHTWLIATYDHNDYTPCITTCIA
jgi:hypothetical protein